MGAAAGQGSPASDPSGRGLARWRLWQLRSLALGVGILVALVAGEGVLQLVGPTESVFAGALYQADPHCGYRLAPGRHGDVVVNRHGLRDAPRELEKPSGARRVLVLGDSFAYGASVERELGFPHVLEDRLGPGVEVINSGVPGWSTVQEAAYLEHYGLAWQPDAVVLALFVGNDVWENVGGTSFDVVDGRLAPNEARPARSWLRRLYGRSKVYQRLRQLPRQLSDVLRGDSSVARSYHKIERKRMGVCATGAAAESWQGAWQATRRELTRIRTLAAPAPLVVLVIPDEFQVDPALREAVAGRYALDLSSGYDWDLPQRRLAALCDELGVERVDVLAELRARTAAGARQYLPLDSHWNAAGNRLAAEALAETATLLALRGSE